LTSIRASAVWAIPAAVVCAVVGGFVLAHLPGLSGDTVALVHGAHTIYYCLSHGITSYCDRQAQFVPGSAATLKAHGVVQGAVAPYPLFQYVPAFILTRLGMSDPNVYQAFSVISLIAFFGVVTLCGWTAARTGRRWAPVVTVLILITSPLIYYSWLTFGESLAAFLIVLLAVAALRRWSPLAIALCALSATLTKETVFPIIALLGVAALWATPIARRPLRRGHWIGLATGVVAGVVVAAAFNWFRYHQLTNYTYGQSFEQVPGVPRRLGLSVALWISPNGGVVDFWLLAAAVAVGLVAIVALSLIRRPISVARLLPAGALVVCLLLLTGTLASWFAPFGWVAWGPRLMLPPLPAIILIALVVYADDVEAVMRPMLATGWRVGLVALVVVAFALPQINVLYANAIVGGLFAPDGTCPVSASVQADPTYYYRCIDHWAWGRHWILLDSFKAFDHLGGVLFALACAAAWVWLVWYAGASQRLYGKRGEPQAIVAGAGP
jgi:hypothetical protein